MNLKKTKENTGSAGIKYPVPSFLLCLLIINTQELLKGKHKEKSPSSSYT
jgi:hypothetical protein